MKHVITLLYFVFLFLASCNQSGSNDGNNSDQDALNNGLSNSQTDNLDVIHKDYEEFYPSGALKIEGDFDEKKQRNGLWVSYYENGIKWSESFYVHGLKEGHSVTFHPNGKVRYIGEYKDDKQTGNWRFFDESGELVREENY